MEQVTLASSVNIDARHWPSILSWNSSVVAIKAGKLPQLMNALQNSGTDPQKWPVILKSDCAVNVVKDGNLLRVLRMLATTGIDSGHWHQILNNATTTRSIIEQPSTFPTIVENRRQALSSYPPHKALHRGSPQARRITDYDRQIVQIWTRPNAGSPGSVLLVGCCLYVWQTFDIRPGHHST